MKFDFEKRKLIAPAALLLLVAVIVCSSFILKSDSRRTAYVDVGQLYNEFAMKKELESKLSTVQLARKSIIDSMTLDLNILSNRLQHNAPDSLAKQFEYKRQELLYQKQAFDSDNEAVTNQYTTQIWKQLNQYIADYGKEKDYDYIFGGDGSGTMMYAREGLNITTELKAYVNQRYKGGK